MACWVNWSQSPSYAIESTSVDVAVLEALAGLRQQVRGVGHRLHAAGDDDVDLAGADQLVGQGDGVEAREAHLVDGDRRARSSGCPPALPAVRAGFWPAPAWRPGP